MADQSAKICPSKTRRIARTKAAKQAHLQRERKDLGLDFQFRNQQVAGSSPAVGSILKSITYEPV
jgi:hypothetical protein